VKGMCRIVLSKRNIAHYEHWLFCELEPPDYDSQQIFYIRSNSFFAFLYEHEVCRTTRDLLVATKGHEKVHNWIQEVMNDEVLRLFFDVMEME